MIGFDFILWESKFAKKAIISLNEGVALKNKSELIWKIVFYCKAHFEECCHTIIIGKTNLIYLINLKLQLECVRLHAAVAVFNYK